MKQNIKLIDLSEKSVKKIIRDYENYVKWRKIAKKFNISTSTIRLILIKNDVKRRKKSTHNLLNQKFSHLKVIRLHENNKYPLKKRWLCLCDCGKQKITTGDCLIYGKTKSCGCSKSIPNIKNHNWRGYKEISLAFFNGIKRGAKSRKIKFNLTIKQIWNLFLKQNRTCSLSGMDLKFSFKNRGNDRTVSLDRIDSSKGYTLDNVQWVHKKVNFMKLNMTDSEFVKTCNQITNFQKSNVIKRPC